MTSASTRRRRRDRTPRTPSADGSTIALFLYSAVGFLYFTAGATVYIVEIVAVFASVHVALLASKGRRSARFSETYRSRLPGLLLSLLAVWLLGTLISDLVNATPPGDSMRGIARVISLAALLVSMLYFVGAKPIRILAVWWGLAVGQLVGLAVQPGSYFAGEPWKFGFSLPLSVIAFLLASSKFRRFDFLIAFAMSGVHFALETRSLAAVCLVAALALLVRRRRGVGSSTVRLTLVFVAGVVGSLGVVSLFERLAVGGYFGESARVRALVQSQGEFGVLLTGRAETGFSLRSILEHPVAGVGSYGSPSRDVIDAQVELLMNSGYTTVARQALDGEWSSFHSALFGSVAENGILALAFWAVVAFVFARGFVDVVSGGARYPQILAFVCSIGVWDLLFSPFGADRKFFVAASIVTALTLRARQEPLTGEDLEKSEP